MVFETGVRSAVGITSRRRDGPPRAGALALESGPERTPIPVRVFSDFPVRLARRHDLSNRPRWSVKGAGREPTSFRRE